jgi:two-component system, OmpR family, sensor histidine kinase CiaH
MFSKTRNKLTLNFVGILIVFLIAFNISSYLILSSQLYGDREKEITRLAETIAEDQAALLWSGPPRSEQPNTSKGKKKESHDDKEEHSEHDDIEKMTVLRPFYYVLDKKGNWVADDEPYSLNRDQMVRELKSWVPKSNEVKYIDYQGRSEDKIHFLFAGHAVYSNGEYMGSVYTGADISQQMEVVGKFMLVSLVLSGLFFVVSVVLGYFMSGRAMVPIIHSFNKQRQFVADASHELRTPLSVVLSSLEVIEVEEKDRMEPISKQVLEDMKDEVKRMSGLVAQMLSLARADSEDVQLRLETSPLREELTKLVRKFQPLADKQGLSFTTDFQPDLNIQADREYFHQLITILIDNAIQYTPEQRSIHLSAERQDRYVVISITDTGIGISPEQLDHIFERFYRADVSRSRSTGHAGLGLSIARWIVESHGGKIHVESQLGEGSTFTVYLP